MLPALWLAGASAATAVLPLITLPLAALLVRTVATASDGATLNTALARTAALEVGFALLFAVGLLL
jgi:1,4-dihydroxy-2-naphthoate octaprenyltransferase